MRIIKVAAKRKVAIFVLFTEAEALLMGVQLALDANYTNCIFKTNALLLFQALNVEGAGFWKTGVIVNTVKHKCSNFNFCRFCFVKRSGNKPTD